VKGPVYLHRKKQQFNSDAREDKGEGKGGRERPDIMRRGTPTQKATYPGNGSTPQSVNDMSGVQNTNRNKLRKP